MAAILPQNDDGCYIVEVDSNSQVLEKPSSKSVVWEIEESAAEDASLLKLKSESESDDGMNSWESGTEGLSVIHETALVQTSVIVKNGESLGADVKEKNAQMFPENWQKKKRYSRKELEGLRNVGGEEGQMRKWTEIYCGLGPAVQEKYDALVGHHPNRNQKGKKLGEGSSVYIEQKDIDMEIPKDTFGMPPFTGCPVEQEYEEYDSDEEYSSILKPAFSVNGEPNFESGPPEDGFEYLRRVRWEAAQLPKVKIGKVDESILLAKQTNYMPQVPDLAKCPKQLMPLKEWEDAFLADFSDLRMALSRYGDSKGHLQSSAMREEGSPKLLETMLLEHFESTPCEGESSVIVSDSSASNAASKASESEYPTLSTIVEMDSVARVSSLRKRINMAASATHLSGNDCLWLFALSAAVDSPLDADTCASFRSLLRKCALLRAEKSVVDEEIAMLNILATISGRYFGQLEH